MMQSLLKVEMIRSQKLRDSARGEPCTMFAPGCTGGGADTVLCHSNMQVHGKSRGMKAHDIFSFYGCSNCNAWYDDSKATREEKQAYLLPAMARSQIRFYEKELLVVA